MEMGSWGFYAVGGNLDAELMRMCGIHGVDSVEFIFFWLRYRRGYTMQIDVSECSKCIMDCAR